ncbi:hypothetical protein B0T26DRAFT_744079 [Lasiosphaeria miniovina]|uniref:Protein kinase domain-containing protein n=1 Tax=Lasiosphaeria miniovina TaxID=1954250 RepID=A0AA40DP62_9PEZI|nr:uncharacterized protein B0T26DRAFT_744079 [Lasiosphaeria miniovina]KAK0707028.1 hypothetical protein B0T26DRAFT_744079 [Lasiosphaeria miniovina]
MADADTDADVVESFKSSIGTSLQSPYAEVHVLLIAWSQNDLGGAEDENRDLRAVFEKDYNYTTVSFFPIPVDGSQRRRLNSEISTFVENQSRRRDSLVIVYYAGNCSANKQGLAEGDVLLVLDCCNASLITRGSKDDGGRFELIAASAKGAKTPVPGRKSFTRALIRLLGQHAEKGISSESLASKLREDEKITETPVFHDFVRQYSTRIRLQRLQDPDSQSGGFIQKSVGYLLFKASLSEDVTGLQVASWLKTAPPENVTAVSIEAVVSRARRMQSALRDGAFPPGSMFERLSAPARAEILRCLRGLNTVMASSAEHASIAAAAVGSFEKEPIESSLGEIQDVVSTVCAAVETPLLLDVRDVGGALSHDSQEPSGLGSGDSFYELLAAADVDAALTLRQAVLSDGPCRYSSEISRDKIVFSSPTSRGDGTSSGQPYHRRIKFGAMDSRPVIMEIYKYKEAPDHSGEPYPQTLQQVRRMTGLLCHPKGKGFHILPCAGFFRDRLRQELGLVFEAPLTFQPEGSNSHDFATLAELYKIHKLVPLGHRIHLAWALAVAVEHFHRVGWVHKSIRSGIVAFMAAGPEAASSSSSLSSSSSSPSPSPSSSPASEPNGDDDHGGAVPGPHGQQLVPLVGRFDLGRPNLFGFEYSRAGDMTTYLDEDHSLPNSLYRHPGRWGRPAARFDKSHDAYALGVVMLEIALWKDIRSAAPPYLDRLGGRVVAAEVASVLGEICARTLPHQVGAVFTQCIRTKGMSEYEAQVYFHRHVTGPLGKAVRRV